MAAADKLAFVLIFAAVAAAVQAGESVRHRRPPSPAAAAAADAAGRRFDAKVVRRIFEFNFEITG